MKGMYFVVHCKLNFYLYLKDALYLKPLNAIYLKNHIKYTKNLEISYFFKILTNF